MNETYRHPHTWSALLEHHNITPEKPLQNKAIREPPNCDEGEPWLKKILGIHYFYYSNQTRDDVEAHFPAHMQDEPESDGFNRSITAVIKHVPGTLRNFTLNGYLLINIIFLEYLQSQKAI